MSNWVWKTREDKITSYVVFILANSCMPTLLKQKPSSLITVHKKYINNRKKFFAVLGREIASFQVNYKILYETKEMYFLFVYDSCLLGKILAENQTNNILIENGYQDKDLKDGLKQFKKRFQKFKEKEIEFPHEVGIFLGYPIEDVEAYILNKGKNYKLCGYWKVYNNVEQAKRTFQFFTDTRNDAMRLLISGRELNEIKNYS